MAFEKLEPIGIEADDVRTGMIVSTIANTHRDKKKKSRPWTSEEMRPVWDEEDSKLHTGPEKHVTQAAQFGFMKRFASMWNRRFPKKVT